MAILCNSCPKWMPNKLLSDNNNRLTRPHCVSTRPEVREYRTENEDGSVWKLVEELKQCAQRRDLQRGRHLHLNAREAGFQINTYVSNTLIHMYSMCGSMREARDVFQNMTHRDVVSWTSLILGYVENGESLVALDAFAHMDCAPNHVTFVAALKACGSLASNRQLDKQDCLQRGMAIHRQARESGFNNEVNVASTLVDMYSKCGSVWHAQCVFNEMTDRNVVAWNSLMLGYVENSKGVVALHVFSSMDCLPDGISFVAALKACAGLAANKQMNKSMCLQQGMVIHREARERGVERDVSVANTLIDMYGKCGSMLYARSVYEKINGGRNVVASTALMLGYVENGESVMALDVFGSVKCVPNEVMFVAALKACASIGWLETGQKVHEQIRERGMEQEEMVANSLVDFYAKCGSMAGAEEVFRKMRTRTAVSWTALIGGYASLGETSQVFSAVKNMQESGVRMDGVTMLSVLTACSHAGMLEEGRKYFDSMPKHGITPTVEHYTCMVDMLGRANRFQEALSFIRSMPFRPDSVVWKALLTACRKWNNVEAGKVAFSELIRDKEHKAFAYVTMGNIYKNLGMTSEEEQIRNESQDVKKPVQTWWTEPSQKTPVSSESEPVGITVVGDKKTSPLKEEVSAPPVDSAPVGDKVSLVKEEVSTLTTDATVVGDKKVSPVKKEGKPPTTDAIGVSLVKEETPVKRKTIKIPAANKGDNKVEFNILDYMAEDPLCDHSEIIAIAHALVHSKEGQTIRIVKDTRTCEQCHPLICKISKKEAREIVFRDGSRIHIFKDGMCNCKDNW